MIDFHDVHFVTSALHPEEFPTLKNDQGNILPEIAVVGRSNVGKSSLLNVLFQKKLVKTSATPGKTQRINFFVADKRVLLVDLPGYGYSKAPKELVGEWSSAIDAYLNTRTTLKLILLLIDVRRGPSERENAMLAWAETKQIPVLVIFTKTDTVSANEQKKTMSTISGQTIPFSKKDPSARNRLLREVNKYDFAQR